MKAQFFLFNIEVNGEYVALALNGNQFVLCKGNNSNNKMLKVYNFKIKSGIGKWSIGSV
jgi:hypothetical protein